ncbi:MAG: hypothetical protein ACF8MF_09775 [Phycisphaerales bacterium JB052]
MSTEDPKHDDQTRALEDSIDHLLDEADAPRAMDDEPEAEGAPEAGTNESEESQQALDSLDAVEQRAQSLIEDAIDDLVDTAPSAVPITDTEPQAEVEAEAVGDTTLSDEVIDAALDALEDTPFPTTTKTLDDGASDVAESQELEQASDTQPETTEASDEASDITASDAESLINDIADELTNSAPIEEQPAPAPESPAPQADPADNPIGEPIDEHAVEQTDEAGATSEAPPEPSSGENSTTDPIATPSDEDEQASQDEVMSTISDLDTTLAGLDDALLMGDFESPDGDTISADSLEQSDATSLLDQLGISDIKIDEPTPKPESTPSETPAPDTTELSVEAKQSDSVEPTSEPDPQPEPVAIDAQSAAKARAEDGKAHEESHKSVSPAPLSNEPGIDELEDEVLSIWATAQRFIVIHSKRLLTLTKVHGGPFGAKLVLLINKPIKDRPAQLRDSIGYLALWTTLLATVLWVYLAFVRETPTPVPSQAPTRVMLPGETGDPLVHNESP